MARQCLFQMCAFGKRVELTLYAITPNLFDAKNIKANKITQERKLLSGSHSKTFTFHYEVVVKVILSQVCGGK